MNGVNSLEGFFEDKGYFCPVCLEPYNLTERSKQPTLTCQQHNVCIDCLTNCGNDWKTCPTCRDVFKFDITKINPNSQIITAMETIKSLWEQLSKAAPAAAAMAAPQPAVAAPVVVEQPKPLAIPENFKTHFLCQEIKKINDETPNIAAAFNHIVQVMNWNTVDVELYNDFRENNSSWVALCDKNSNEILGTGRLSETQSKGAWEVHWMGVTHQSEKDYVELYKHIAHFIESQASDNRDDWKNYSLTSYYNYDTEEKWLDNVVDMFHEHHRRYDLVTLYRTWGTQRKLTLFPCRKAGHVQNNFILDQNYRLIPNTKVEDEIALLTHKYLTDYRLETAITKWAAENATSAGPILNAFKTAPKSFYVYTLEDRAKGFIEFQLKEAQIKVNRCCLLNESLKYADHFISQFMTVVRTQLTLSNHVVAKKVTFTYYDDLQPRIREAIDAAQGLAYEPS